MARRTSNKESVPVQTDPVTYRGILRFWFEEIDKSGWWRKDPALDQQIIARYSAIHAAANRCELYSWRASAEGRLAEIIILDQFSRNMYRDRPRSFASDSLALALAQEAVADGADQEVMEIQRDFFYMPFMHSESRVIHETAVSLFETRGSRSILEYELKHKAIIDRFGRYPHRNEILGRESTADEQKFLQQPGSGF